MDSYFAAAGGASAAAGWSGSRAQDTPDKTAVDGDTRRTRPAYGGSSSSASSTPSFRRASIYPSSPTQDLANPSSPPMFDPRESNSIRDNIQGLVRAGQGVSASSNQPQGLAGLMGGSGKAPRMHRVNSGPTLDEQEITARLEQEMELAKAKWAGKPVTTGAPGGISMASVMQGRAQGGIASPSPAASQKWISRPTTATAAAPPASTKLAVTIPSIRAQPSPSPVTFPTGPHSATFAGTTFTNPFPSSPATATSNPRSLADMLGSRASGPRLNKPTASPIETGDGPAHGRAGNSTVALPGMVRSTSGTVRERARSLATLGGQEWAPKEVLEARAFTRVPGVGGLVAGRLKSAEAIVQPVAEAESPKKGRSVMDRWNRDEPNSATSSPVAAKKMDGRWANRSQSVDVRDPRVLTGLKGGEFQKGFNQLPIDSPRPVVASSSSSSLLIPSLSRPASTAASPVASHNTSPTLRGDPSPRFDSPPMDNSTWGELGASSVPTRGWSGPPIGVREVRKPGIDKDVGASAGAQPQGVALPGMSKPGVTPAKRTLGDEPTDEMKESTQTTPEIACKWIAPARPSAMQIATSFGEARKPDSFETFDAPRPWSPSKARHGASASVSSARSRPTSFVASSRPVSIFGTPQRALQTDVEMDVPPSPGPSVRSAIASWGTPLKSAPLPLAATPAPRPPSRRLSDDWTTKAPQPTRSSSDEMVLDRARPRSTITPPPAIGAPPASPTASCYSVSSSCASPIELGDAVYESEIIATVDTSSLRVWQGKDATLDEATQGQLEKLARTLRTTLEISRQGLESPALVDAMGAGRLVIRQGERSAYNVYDSRLYVVRVEPAGTFVEEFSMVASSVCSRTCVVVALMGEVNIWVGRGSTREEQRAARQFADQIADGRSITTMDEGAETDYFWHVLDGMDYASAHHWRFKAIPRPEVFPVSSTTASLSSLSRATLPQNCISLVDAGYEHFIVVPSSERDQKSHIRTALAASEQLAARWRTRALPFMPPCHVLFFPTVIPVDLRFVARSLDFDALNNGACPRAMDVFTASEMRDLLDE